MKQLFLNSSNLKTDEIDEEVIRVKGLIINHKNEILLGYAHNTYQFPGGHLENGESVKECLKREILEETGMSILIDEMEPLMTIKYFTKNYSNTGKNRCNKLYYFVIKTDALVDLEKTNYTKEEREGNYVLRYVSLDDTPDVIISNVNSSTLQKNIAYEMLEAINEYKIKEQ